MGFYMRMICILIALFFHRFHFRLIAMIKQEMIIKLTLIYYVRLPFVKAHFSLMRLTKLHWRDTLLA